jgi:hypothetical protein
MKLIKNLSWAILLVWCVDACLSPPDYPIVPQISIVNEEISFGKNQFGLDSLEIAINFTDGDGDLGLDDTFKDPKYDQQYFYFITSSGQIQFSTLDQSNVNYKFKRLNPKYNLPDFVTPYNCSSWELKKKNDITIDTIYTELNPNFYNVFVDYFVKNDDGKSFTKFNIDSVFIFPRCGDRSLNGARMPNLSKDPGKSSPLDGKIRFWIKSLGFEPSFGSKTLKLRVSIQDRALHKSNEVDSKEFTLLSIRKR